MIRTVKRKSPITSSGRLLSALLVMLFWLLLAAVTPAQAATIDTLFSTGVDANGALLTQGLVDLHYRISSVNVPPAVSVWQEPVPVPAVGPQIAADQNAYVVFDSMNPWVANGPASQWLAPSSNTYGDSVLFTYQTTFDLTGLDAASAAISGSWAVDDPGWMYLNGKLVAELPFGWMFQQLYGLQVAPNAPQYTANHDFLLTSGFLSGVNTLEFLVWNAGGGPTGLRVEIASATANAAVAEPGTLMLLGSGLIGLLFYRRHAK
jgi:hypothetical protein